MNTPSPTLSGIVHAYLKAVDEGRQPDREALLIEHPELADDLKAFFADQDAFDRVAEPLQSRSNHDSTKTRVGGKVRSPNLEPAPASLGNYEIIEVIAKGGMGVVYKAKHLKLQRLVALKMLLHGQASSAEDLARFRAEAEAVAELDHPNIVPIFEIGDQDGKNFFAMKFIDGGSLAQRRDEFLNDFPAVAYLIAVVARAIHFAHQHGILHRDLKPGNILLEAHGSRSVGLTPYVTDFGLAKRLESEANLTQTDAIVGTPNYMAPEQAAGVRNLTTAVDTYGLGAILYELLCGQKVFASDQPMVTLLKVREQEPEPPRRINPRIPSDLETICLKCLEKDPLKRYASAAELADDLERWRAGEPIAARPATPIEKLVKWTRRRPALAGSAFALSSMFLLSFVLITWQWRVAVQAENAATAALGEAERMTIEARQSRDRESEARALADQANRTANAQLYLRTIDLANREFTDGRCDRARSLLQECSWDLRAFEWHILYAPFAQLRVWNLRSASTFRPDGLQLARVAGPNEILELIDLPSFQKKHQLGKQIRALAYAPDQRSIAALTIEPTGAGIRFWNPIDGSPRGFAPLPHWKQGGTLAFSPDGTLVFVGAKDRIAVVSAADFKHVHDIPARGDIVQLAVPDEKHLLVGTSDGSIQEWDQATRTLTRTWPTEVNDKLRAFESGFLAVQGNLVARPGPKSEVQVIDRAESTLATYQAHDSTMTSACFTAEEKVLLTGWENGVIRAWDLETGILKRQERHHSFRVLNIQSSEQWTLSGDIISAVLRPTRLGDHVSLESSSDCTAATPLLSFSADGSRAALSINDAELRVWNTITGKPIASLKAPGHRITCYSLCPDGRHVLTAGKDRTLRRWDVATARELSRQSLEVEPTALAVHPTKSEYAIQGQRTLLLGDGELKQPPTARVRNLPADLRAFRFSSDGERMGGIANKQLLVFHRDGSSLHKTDLAGMRFNEISLSPDLHHAALIHIKDINLLDLATGRVSNTMRTSGSALLHSAFNSDGRRLAASLSLGTQLEIRDPNSGDLVHEMNTKRPFLSQVVFLGDGRRLAVTSIMNRETVILGPSEPSPFRAQGSAADTTCLAANDARIFAAGPTSIRAWDSVTGSLLRNLSGTRFCRMSPDQRELAALADNKELLILDQEGKELARFPCPIKDIVGLDHNGDHLLLAGKTTVLVRERHSDREVLRLTPKQLPTSAVLIGDLLALGTGTGTIQVHATATGTETRQLAEHQGAVHCLASSPDRRVLASAAADNTIRIWNLDTGKTLHVLKGHAFPVKCLAFRADGKRLVSGSDDHTVKVWDLESGKELASHGCTAPIQAVAFIGSSQRIAWTCVDDLLTCPAP